MKVIVKPIFLILLGAMLLRLWGISYGLPLFLVNDETPHVYGALKMIELKTLIPALHAEEFRAVLYYPPLLSYFFLIVLTPVIAIHYLASGMPPADTYRAMLALDPSFLWVAARVWMALIGVVGIYLTYRIAWHLSGSRRAALFAATFLALSFYHLQLSHNVRHWLPASVLLAFLWERALAMRGRGDPLRSWAFLYAILGVATGGVNTAAAVGIVPLAAARLSGGLRNFFSRQALVLLAVFVLVTIAGVALYPYGLTRAEGAPGAASDVAGRISLLATKGIGDWLRFIGGYIRTLWEFETPIFIFSLIGMAFFWLWRSPAQLSAPESLAGKRFWVGVTIVYVVAFFTLLYLFDDFTARGVVFVTPIFAAFAAYAIHVFFEQIRFVIHSRFLRSTFYVLLSILAFGWSLAVDLRYQWLLAQPDTRLVAREWLLENLPPGARVVMDTQYLRLPNTPEGAELVGAIDPAALRAADRAVLALGPDAPQPAVANLNLDLVLPEIRSRLIADTDAFLRRGFTHFVVEYRLADAVRDDTRRILEQGRRIAHFGPWRDERPVAVDGSGKLERLDFDDLFALDRFGHFVDVYTLQSPVPSP